MILSDSTIRTLIESEALIERHDPNMVVQCAYTLRVGKVILPENGKLYEFSSAKRVWMLKPGHVVYVVTEETLKMPSHICASYEPLNRIARDGVLLVNSSLVEPGYSGPVSGVLINISNQDFPIRYKDPLGKLIFQKLDELPLVKRPISIEYDQYVSDTALLACKAHRTFLNLEEVEKKAGEAASRAISSATVKAGFVIAALLVFASLEPFVSKFLYERTGLTTTTQRVLDQKEAYERLIKNMQKEGELDKQRVEKLEGDVKELKLQVGQQNGKSTSNGTKNPTLGP